MKLIMANCNANQNRIILKKCLVVITLLMIIWAYGCSSGSDDSSTSSSVNPGSGTVTIIQESKMGWTVKGYNISPVWDSHLNFPEAKEIARWAAEHGCNSITLKVTVYQDKLSSNSIYKAISDTRCMVRTPSDQSLKDFIAWLKAKGFHVILRIYVDVEDECKGLGYWRGNIQPADAAVWFRNWQNIMSGYAQIAQDTGVDILIAGGELASLSYRYRENWEQFFTAIRLIFHGKITYAAVWPNEAGKTAEAHQVVFYDLLDYIGLDIYPEASIEQTPTFASMQQIMQEHRSQIDEWYDKAGFSSKKILITEVGYPVRPYCAHCPYDPWLNSQVDEICQRNALQALLYAIKGDSRIIGAIIYESIINYSQDRYSIKGRQAEQVLTELFLP